MIAKYKRGWYNDSYRHSLAAKGIKSKHDWRFHSRKHPIYVVHTSETDHAEFHHKADADEYASMQGGVVEEAYYAKKDFVPDVTIDLTRLQPPKVSFEDRPWLIDRLDSEDRAAQGKEPEFYNVVLETPGEGEDRTINVPGDQFAAIGRGAHVAKEKLSEIPYPSAEDWRQFGTDFGEGLQRREEEFIAGVKGFGKGAKKLGERAAHSEAIQATKRGLKRGVGFAEFAATNPELARKYTKDSVREWGLDHAPREVLSELHRSEMKAKHDQEKRAAKLMQMARNL